LQALQTTIPFYLTVAIQSTTFVHRRVTFHSPTGQMQV